MQVLPASEVLRHSGVGEIALFKAHQIELNPTVELNIVAWMAVRASLPIRNVEFSMSVGSLGPDFAHACDERNSRMPGCTGRLLVW